MSLKSRPTFAVDLEESPSAVLARLQTQLGAPGVQVRWARTPGGGGAHAVGQAGAGDHFALTIEDARRHFWSPWLMVDVSAGDRGTHVFARFTPHPSVWTGYAFAYMTLASIGFFSLIFAYACSVSGSHGGATAWIPWIAPVCAGVAFLLWASAQVGQRLARAEMDDLKHCLDAGLAAGPPRPHAGP